MHERSKIEPGRYVLFSLHLFRHTRDQRDKRLQVQSSTIKSNASALSCVSCGMSSISTRIASRLGVSPEKARPEVCLNPAANVRSRYKGETGYILSRDLILRHGSPWPRLSRARVVGAQESS
jgi:hypothetical protein